MRFAVIPTAGKRDSLMRAHAAIAPQVDYVIIVHNGPMEYIPTSDECMGTLLIPYHEVPFNLSRTWNRGIASAGSIARGHHEQAWTVAILNDDAIVPEGWYDAVVTAMGRNEAAVGCSGGYNLTHRDRGPYPLDQRMTGWAFILDGELSPLADDRFGWWFGDDDLGWRAAEMGGMTMVQGYPVQNLYPNGSFTPELHVQAAKDAEFFVKKWGVRPW